MLPQLANMRAWIVRKKEAKRLATLLKKKAYVLCTIKSVEDTQYKIEDCRPGESDLPF